MIAALLQHDASTHRPWLSFPHMPPLLVRTTLKATGWRYNGVARAWNHTAASPPMPSGVTIALGGEADVSTITSDPGAEILARLSATRARIAALPAQEGAHVR